MSTPDFFNQPAEEVFVPPTPAELQQKSLTAFLNSTALYVLAYLSAEIVYRLTTALTAARLHIPNVWYLSRMQFLIPNSAWWQGRVLTVYSMGPLLTLTVGLVAGLWFWQRRRFRRGVFKQYLMWLLLHCLNWFFGSMVADTFTQSGFWYVPSWLFLAGNGVNIAVAVVFGLILMGLGFLLAPVFLQSHDSRTLMRYEERPRLLLAGLLGPWLAGSVVLAVAKFPLLTVNELLHYATMLLLLLVPLAFASTNELFEFTIEAPQKTRVAWAWVVLLGLLLLGMRLVLGPGLRFG